MGKFAIDKKELIQLCLKSKYHFDVQTTKSEKISGELDNVIYYFLENNNVSEKWINKNVKLKKLTDKTLKNLSKNKQKNIALVKSIVVQEVLNTYYMELLYKKLVIDGTCYVPQSLSISPKVTWLATRKNIQNLEAKELIKLINKPIEKLIINEVVEVAKTNEVVEVAKIDEAIKTNEEVAPKTENPFLVSRVRMLKYISDNKETLKELLVEIDGLKKGNDKELWNTKANDLVQLVSGGDFTAMDWQEVYKLVRHRVKLT